MSKIKYAANFITIGRIAGTIPLLFIEPLSIPFFALYALCGLSDMADGYIARKTNTAGKLGEVLDSIADFVFIAAMLFVFIPIIPWKEWMLCWIAGIALIRFATLGIGCLKYKAFSSLHTYLNKATGLTLFCFPLIYLAAGLTITAIILGGLASLSALEELIITIRSRRLNRNIRGIWSSKD